MSRARSKPLSAWNPEKWEKNCGGDYRKWVANRFSTSNELSKQWLLHFEHIVSQGAGAEMRAEPYQREAILRLIYMLEMGSNYSSENLLPMNCIAAKMATGTGKTCVISNLISWAKSSNTDSGADLFILLCPNTIVRQRLWDSFRAEENNFTKIGFSIPTISAINLSDGDTLNLDHHDLIITNIHRLFEGTRSGEELKDYLEKSGKRFIVINDEAHNSVTSGYENVIETLMKMPGFRARIDLTATPQRSDMKEIPSHFIFEYPALFGIEGRGTYPLDVIRGDRTFTPDDVSWSNTEGRQVLKKPVIWRPIFDHVTFSISSSRTKVELPGELLSVLLSKDSQHLEESKEIRKKYKLPDSIRKSSIASTRAFKLALLTKGKELLVKSRENVQEGMNPYKSILFAVAMNRNEAKESADILAEMGLKTLVVIGKNTSTEDLAEDVPADELIATETVSGKIIPKDALRALVGLLGKGKSEFEFEGEVYGCDYDAVISVYMLKEGWDVNCVEVMVLLRPFDSLLFAQQTVGRGLRIRRDLKDGSYEQILSVIEPPNWGLGILWEELGAEVEGTDSYLTKRLLNIMMNVSTDNFISHGQKIAEKIEDDGYRNLLLSNLDKREMLVGHLLKFEKARLTQREIIKSIRDEAKNCKSVAIESALIDKIKDDELKAILLSSAELADHDGLIAAIDSFFSPKEIDVPKRRDDRARFLKLKSKIDLIENRDFETFEKLVETVIDGRLDECFENLYTREGWAIDEIKTNQIESVKSGRRKLSDWSEVFSGSKASLDSSDRNISESELLPSLIHDFASRLEIEVISRRLPNIGESYSQISAMISKIKPINSILLNQNISNDVETFHNSWIDSTNQFIEKVGNWLDLSITGTEGQQDLPNSPIVPTGRYDLIAYKNSLFDKEYMQSSYERALANYIDIQGIFSTPKSALSAFNGHRVLAWTTSHGIYIPLPGGRSYKPDFLIAIGDEEGQFIAHLIIETKRDDMEATDDVQAKSEATKAFCRCFENCFYEILTSEDLPKSIAA